MRLERSNHDFTRLALIDLGLVRLLRRQFIQARWVRVLLMLQPSVVENATCCCLQEPRWPVDDRLEGVGRVELQVQFLSDVVNVRCIVAKQATHRFLGVVAHLLL